MKTKDNFKQLSIFENNKVSKYKDQCDICKKFSYCRGYKGQVLCESCINNIKE